MHSKSRKDRREYFIILPFGGYFLISDVMGVASLGFAAHGNQKAWACYD